jgi:hypothetical protein
MRALAGLIAFSSLVVFLAIMIISEGIKNRKKNR